MAAGNSATITVHSHLLKVWMRFLRACNNGKLKLLPPLTNYSQPQALEMAADVALLLIVYK